MKRLLTPVIVALVLLLAACTPIYITYPNAVPQAQAPVPTSASGAGSRGLGTIVASGPSIINNNLTITGTLTAGTGVVTGTHTSAALVSSSALVKGDAIITGTLTAATGVITGTQTAASSVSSSSLVTGNEIVTGTLTAATGVITGALSAGTLNISGGSFLTGTVNAGGFIVLAKASNITVTDNSIITPTATYQPLTADGAVGTDQIAILSAGTLLYLSNVSANAITITDTGTLKLSADIALGQYDTLTLLSDGTNWIQIATSNN